MYLRGKLSWLPDSVKIWLLKRKVKQLREHLIQGGRQAFDKPLWFSSVLRFMPDGTLSCMAEKKRNDERKRVLQDKANNVRSSFNVAVQLADEILAETSLSKIFELEKRLQEQANEAYKLYDELDAAYRERFTRFTN